MDRLTFNSQMERLRNTYGKERYPTERLTVLWRAFQSVPDREFEDAVDQCIASLRSAPLVDELEEQVAKARERVREAMSRDAVQGRSFVGILEAAANTSEESSAFAKTCVRLLKEKKTYTARQWEEACGYLDQTAQGLNPVCSYCFREQYVYRPEGFYRCTCREGQKLPTDAVGPPDKNGERERIRIHDFSMGK